MTLAEMQRTFVAALMKSPASREHARQATRLIKPGQQMGSVARLRIYQRSYWARLVDSLGDDFPGLISILGLRAFRRVAKAYLSECPSRSFTLRDLGIDLAAWLRMHREQAGTQPDLTIDMAQLEWAHINAYDAPSRNPLGPENLIELTPLAQLGLQPHLTPLSTCYPVDDIRIRANRTGRRRSAGAIQSQQVFLAVYRLDLGVYYRRLAPAEFQLLQSLRAGEPLGTAILLAFRDTPIDEQEQAESIRTWFGIWAELGWLTTPQVNARER